MDTVLIILSVLGLFAILLSAYVATVGSRTYATTDRNPRSNLGTKEYQTRNSIDRRNGKIAAFPLTVDGLIISADRRNISDRRIAA